MIKALKWACAPIGWVGLGLVCVGFGLFIIVDEGPMEFWSQVKLAYQELLADWRA